MLAAKRLAGVTPEVNLREFATYIPEPSANKANTEESVVPQRIYAF